MLFSREALALSGPAVARELRRGYRHRVFWQGVASNVLNPKVVLFFLAFPPQFAGDGGSGLRFLLLGLLFVALTLVATTILALSCGTVGDWLKGRHGVAEATGRAAGGVLVAPAVRLALANAR
jgi:threonine/homoserine/homoserine lactone efflux protein